MQSSTNNIIYFNAVFNFLRMLVGATSTIYLINNGMNMVELGVLKSIQSVIYLLFDIPTSYLADKYSRKVAFLIAIVLGGLWLVITGFSNSVEYYFFAEILNSFSLTIIGGVVFAYTIDNSADVKNAEYILNRMNKLLFFFMAIASIIGALLYMLDPKLPWIVSGFSCLILAVVGIYYLPKPVVIKPSQKVSLLSSLKQVKTMHASFLIEGFNLACLLAVLQIFIQYWQVMIDAVFNTSLSGLVYGVIFALILLAQSFSGYLYPKINNIKNNAIVLAGLVIFVMLLIAFAYATQQSILFTILVIVIFGLLQSVIAVSRSAYHAGISSNRSMYESLVSTCSKLISIAMFLFISYSIEILHWDLIILVLACFTLLNILIRLNLISKLRVK